MKFNFYQLAFGATLLSVGATALAAPVTVEEARERANEFLTGNVVTTPQHRKPAQMVLAYTATASAGECFYVFNNPNGGYMILSADDRLPAVLGYSYEGKFDEENMPDNMRWWLEGYQKEISLFLEADPDLKPMSVNRARPLDNPVIEPLCTTKWNQDAPYNNDCPYDSFGRGQSVTGCVATAMAQVMKYHEWPKNPTGTNGSFIFSGTTLDWENMVDEYIPGSYTEKQASAVAKLMRQCGASVNMTYSAYSSGAYSADVQVAWRTYFDYNPEMEFKYRDYYNYSDWNKIVYKELSENGPVYYSGRSSRGGHAFVCDGYAGNNYYHFNWGWGGYQDGYFLLNALNPATGGTGSFAGGYNTDQSVITGVHPRREGESDKNLQALALTTGAFTYNKGRFEITDDPDGFNLIYNALAYPLTAVFGVKVAPFDDPEKAQYISSGGSQTFAWGYGFGNMTATIPSSLADGKYKITPAMKPTGKDWMDVMVPTKFQTYVTLEVKGGKHTFTNEGPSDEAKPQLVAAMPEYPAKMYANTTNAFRITITNIGAGDYMGMVYLMTMDHDDPFGNSISAEKWVTIPSGFSTEVEFTSDDLMAAANYDLYIMDESGYDICDVRSFTIDPSDFKDASHSGNFYVQDFEPRFYTISEEGCGVVLQIVNTGNRDQDVALNIEILDGENLKSLKSFSAENIRVEKSTKKYFNFSKLQLGLEPGDYFWRVTSKDGELLMPVTPLIIHSDVKTTDGISYVVVSERNKRARLVAPGLSEYEGDLVVPARVDGYTIRDFQPGTFTFADELTSLRLPETVTELPNAGFYYAEKLGKLILRSATPPYVDQYAFGPGMPERIVVDMPEGSANYYAAQDGWSQFLISNWTIDEGEVKILTDLQIDPLTGQRFSPYYVGASEKLAFDCEVPEGKYVAAVYKLADGTEGKITDSKRIVLPALNGQSAAVSLKITDDSGVEDLFLEDELGNVYSIDGRLVIRDARKENLRILEKGLYIIGNRKVRL